MRSIINLGIVVLVLIAAYYLTGTPALRLAKLNVATDKLQYMSGDEVQAHFTLSNNTLVPIRMYHPLDVADGELRVFITAADGTYSEYHGSDWATGPREHRATWLLPGAKLTSDAEMYYKPETVTPLTKAGVYEIKATFCGLESAPYKITVVDSPDSKLK